QTVHRSEASIAVPKQNAAAHATAPDQDKENDEEADELAPAALEMDKSADSPLIRKLYEATRETKENNILARLDEATKMMEEGATSGFFAASYSYIALSLEQAGHCTDDIPSEAGLPRKGEVPPLPLHADLTPGLSVPVRLTAQVWSDKSRTGDPITAVVTT